MKRQIILVMTAALFLAGCGRAAEPVVIVPKDEAESQSALSAGQEKSGEHNNEGTASFAGTVSGVF